MSETVRASARRDKAAVPVEYAGQTFRSLLEADLAWHLDEFGVGWAYERRTEYPVLYLPDFTIDSAPPELDLPKWIEVKPQEMLYDLRDRLHVPERFSGYVTVGIDAFGLRDMGYMEIAKPKRLAETPNRLEVGRRHERRYRARGRLTCHVVGSSPQLETSVGRDDARSMSHPLPTVIPRLPRCHI